MGSDVAQQYCNIKEALSLGGEFDPRGSVNLAYRSAQETTLQEQVENPYRLKTDTTLQGRVFPIFY